MKDFKDRMDYIRRTFAPETPAQQAARESMQGENDRIAIYPEEGKLLQVLIRMGGYKKIVEIGTLGGYSTLWLADALPAGGHVWTIEKDPARAKTASDNLRERNDITIVEGDARTALDTLAAHGPFDMVFIDADKLNYAHYLDWAEKHVRKDGLIVGDNTLLFDAVWMQERPARVRETALAAMRAFNARLADPARYHSIMLPTAEGLTMALKLF